MSADLLAAFGDPEPPETPEGPAARPAIGQGQNLDTHRSVEEDTWQSWPRAGQLTPKVTQHTAQTPSPLWQRDQGGADVLFDAEDDEKDQDDDFGEFEEAENGRSTSNADFNIGRPDHDEAQSARWKAEHQSPHTPNRKQQFSQMDLLGLDDEPPTQQRESLGVDATKSENQSLFDDFTYSHQQDRVQEPFADTVTAKRSANQLPVDDGFEDDWGTFEEAQTDKMDSSEQSSSQRAAAQLISAQEQDIWDFSNFTTSVSSGNNQTFPKQRQSLSDPQELPSPSRSQVKATTTSRTKPEESRGPLQTHEADEEEDDWDDFEATQPAAPSKSDTHTSSSSRIPAGESPVPSVTPSRPTNIPPPSTLLQLLPKVFAQLASQASSSASTQPSEVGQLVLHSYTVTARLLSGRSLRWKRDTILAQSMSISSSTAAGGGRGMKLTTLDKGESRKEDQEAELAVAAWTKYAHVLNMAMNKAKVQKPAMSLSATSMKVKTETGLGVVIANHICPICGLKRNERVIGIDSKVDDTFGDFWVEHWGHRDCFDFWYRYKDMLGQR